MKQEKEIRFTIGQESSPIIESVPDNSIFEDQYQKAFSEIATYLQQADEARKANRIERDSEYPNNIIAFIGERGAGKTSCMLSVARMLVDGMHLPNKLKNASFQAADRIDPSYFDEDHNIISIIVAKLFRKFTEELKRRNEFDFTKREKLLACFEETQKNMRCLLGAGHDRSDDLDDLNSLVNLSAAVDLRTSMFNLIDAYLEFFLDRKDSKQMLLLMVDDIDLNTSEADEMAEQIRKYLVLPNVLILMSLKLNQLGRIKWRQYAESYKILLDAGQMSYPMISNMVERYLTKLIPYNHRIFMPDFDVYHSSKLAVEYQGNIKSYTTIREAIPQLIYQKTRYLFYNSSFHTSYIVPRNLRELRLLVTLLVEMEDVNSAVWNSLTEEQKLVRKHRQEYNKSIFKKYLFDTWVLDNLDLMDREAIRELLSVDDASQINSRVLGLLKDRFHLSETEFWKYEENEIEQEITYLLRSDNVAYNISLGDVLSFLNYLEQHCSKQEDQKFIFILRAFYSIRLYEYYDEKIAVLSDEELNREDQPLLPDLINYSEDNSLNDNILHKWKNNSREVCRNDLLSWLSNYDKLVAGRYVNSRIEEFLPKQRKSSARSNRLFNVNSLQALIFDCITSMGDRDVEDKIQLAEFFMLCTARSLDTRNRSKNDIDFYEPEFRTKQEARYAVFIGDQMHNAFFDINAFFYNITRIEECYDRFSYGRFFSHLIEANDIHSLFWNFREATRQRLEENGEEPDSLRVTHAWLSWCTIRNVEILQDLTMQLLREESKYPNSDDCDILIRFFKLVARFEIRTYDKVQNDYCTVSFKFVEHIIALLERVKKNKELRSIFNSIYYPSAANLYEGIIDVKDFMKGWQTKPVHRKDSVIEKIQKRYLLYTWNDQYVSILDNIFKSVPEKIGRDTIQQVIESINKAVQKLD